MRVVKADPEGLCVAAAALKAGGLVAFPTETVYGLGADARDGRAVARIYEAKGRPSFNPLIVHVAADAEVAGLAVLDARAKALAAAFWPGPLTLVLRRVPQCPVSDLVTCGLETIAVRIPSHPVALALIRAAGVPVAAPSANRSGHVSPTTAAHVAADLGARIDVILDGGASEVGVESTVVDLSGAEPVLLRPGGVPSERIAAALGQPLGRRLDEETRPQSPGQLASHYAPRAAVRLDARAVRPGEALLAFGADTPPHDGPCINLSPHGDLVEAAANLFAALRQLDAAGVGSIAVATIPGTGLGEAINDRLRRAAAPRPAPRDEGV
ncbi:MAG: threonylcarbamoyl-AMP synthase [Hyphomicrobiaceae bacterium]|nr:threonylcarbamoyl-AMP synthase [Hyphomicrobiaceae bacterium]